MYTSRLNNKLNYLKPNHKLDRIKKTRKMRFDEPIEVIYKELSLEESCKIIGLNEMLCKVSFYLNDKLFSIYSLREYIMPTSNKVSSFDLENSARLISFTPAYVYNESQLICFDIVLKIYRDGYY